MTRFVLHPLTAVALAAVHELATGNVEWTHIWKGFGALFGAYVFAALAMRGLRPEAQRVISSVDG